MESFISTLENFLGVKKTDFSLADRWTESPPPEAEGRTLAEYMIRVECIGGREHAGCIANLSFRPGTTLFTTTATTNMITSKKITPKSLASASTYPHICSGNDKPLE